MELIDDEFERVFLGVCLVDPKVFINTNFSTDNLGTVAHQLI